jgi:hypothetical protein
MGIADSSRVHLPGLDCYSTVAAPRTTAPLASEVAHHVGLLVGLLVWQIVAAWFGSAEAASGSLAQIAGAALSLAGVSVALVLLKQPHAPACATAMIVGMGGAAGWTKLLGMSCAVIPLVLTTTSIIRLAGLSDERANEAAL